MKKIVLASLLAMAAGCASAQAYVGAGAGWSHIATTCPAAASCKDNDTGFKVYGGYAFNPMIAAELGYVDFGKSTFDYFWTHGEVKVHATTLAVALRAQFGKALDGVLRVGAANVSVSETSNFGFSEDKSSTNAYLGVGLEYAFNKNTKGLLMIDTTKAEDRSGSGNVSLFSVGVQFGF